MTVVALTSVKGSPGATTAAATLAVAARVTGEPTLLVELDPSGGDVRLLADEPVGEPNLLDVAGELRHGVGATPATTEALAAQAIDVLPGLPGFVAPAGAADAATAVASIGDRWTTAFQGFEGTVVIDAGRWDPTQETAGRIAGHDVVGLVVRPTAASVEHARHMVAQVRRAAGRPVAAVVVGERPYDAEAVAGVLDLPLAGALAWDPRGAAALWARGATPAGSRSRLVRSGARVLAGLQAHTPRGRAAHLAGTARPAAPSPRPSAPVAAYRAPSPPAFTSTSVSRPLPEPASAVRVLSERPAVVRVSSGRRGSPPPEGGDAAASPVPAYGRARTAPAPPPPPPPPLAGRARPAGDGPPPPPPPPPPAPETAPPPRPAPAGASGDGAPVRP